MAVEARIGSDSPRLAAAKRYAEKIAVGAGGLRPVRNGREANLLGIRRKSDIRRVTSLVWWHVIIRARNKIAWRSSRSGDHEYMTALAITPMIPVTKQKMVIAARLYWILLSRFIALMVAGIVVTIRIYRRGECDPLAIGRPLFIFRSR